MLHPVLRYVEEERRPDINNMSIDRVSLQFLVYLLTTETWKGKQFFFKKNGLTKVLWLRDVNRLHKNRLRVLQCVTQKYIQNNWIS